MTDKDHADAIREAVHLLNQRIGWATDARLEVTVTVHELQRIGHAPEPKIGVAIKRPIEASA